MRDAGKAREAALNGADAGGAMHAGHGYLGLVKPLAEIAAGEKEFFAPRRVAGDGQAFGRRRAAAQAIAR